MVIDASPRRSLVWSLRWVGDAVGTWVNCLLLAVCVVSGFMGWWLGPSVGGAAAVPTVPDVVFVFSPPLAGIRITDDLLRLHDEIAWQATVVGGTGLPKVVSWGVMVDTLGSGQFCSAPTTPEPVFSDGYWEISGRTETRGSERLIPEVDICWTNKAPIVARGPYLTVAFPTIEVDNATGTVHTALGLTGNLRLVDYTLQSGVSPTRSEFSYSIPGAANAIPMFNNQAWVWDSPTTSISSSAPTLAPGAQPGSPISFVAANLAELQAQNRNVFYAGILLGVGAAAAVALLTNVLGGVDDKRRRSKAMSDAQAE
jgi:hypothetical protein